MLILLGFIFSYKKKAENSHLFENRFLSKKKVQQTKKRTWNYNKIMTIYHRIVKYRLPLHTF